MRKVLTNHPAGTSKMVYTGQWITAFLRWTPTPYTDAGKAGMSATAAQIKAILDGRARIEGDSRDGLRYVEESVSEHAAAE